MTVTAEAADRLRTLLELFYGAQRLLRRSHEQSERTAKLCCGAGALVDEWAAERWAISIVFDEFAEGVSDVIAELEAPERPGQVPS